ncbi:MAG: ATP phosphoribosyltransferase [Chloroflexota bacterium]|nr:ATP phosphoribosyltransferase [Chloroflexota bacterium]
MKLTIALAKGRLLKPTIKLFESLGYDLRPARDSRKLVIDDAANNAWFLIAKPMDVPTYVEYGAADVGVVGQDALFESGVNVYEPLVLGYGACRLIVAGKPELRDGANQNAISPRDVAPDAEWRLRAGLRVATKYPRSAQKHFSARGLSVEIIALYGSIELAPMVGLADLIVDVVDTGRTLRENGLVELDEIFKSQAAFIVNRAAHTLRVDEIRGLIEKINGTQRNADERG